MKYLSPSQFVYGQPDYIYVPLGFSGIHSDMSPVDGFDAGWRSHSDWYHNCHIGMVLVVMIAVVSVISMVVHTAITMSMFIRIIFSVPMFVSTVVSVPMGMFVYSTVVSLPILISLPTILIFMPILFSQNSLFHLRRLSGKFFFFNHFGNRCGPLESQIFSPVFLGPIVRAVLQPIIRARNTHVPAYSDLITLVSHMPLFSANRAPVKAPIRRLKLPLPRLE